MNTAFLAILDGFGKDLGQGGVVAIVSILLVFAILAIIILLTTVIGNAIVKLSGKSKEENKAEAPAPAADGGFEGIDTEDAEAMAAVLVASIDYQNETGKNVKVVSVKELH